MEKEVERTLPVSIFGALLGKANGWDEADEGIQFLDVELNALGLLVINVTDSLLPSLYMNLYKGTLEAYDNDGEVIVLKPNFKALGDAISEANVTEEED